ncbi:TolC family protein [Desulfobacula sp.]|uniref:TolC family protein n=1 Tax=Desulfobacula sp. TaxID=2593537 RepID=UPI00260E9B71|nr:TolC family protein [Desulfobacula sp.]
MKIKTAIILILCLFCISPLWADYDRLKDALQQYTPPEYFTDSLGFKTERLESPIEPDPGTDAVLSRIKTLKQGYEKKISTGHGPFFLCPMDTEMFNRLAVLSMDMEAVRQMVRHHLRLDEIEIVAGVRNPAVIGAQKKVIAELESFDQVMDLDENLKQYSAFTEGLNNKVGPLKMKTSIKQMFPFPGLTALKGRIIHQQVAILVEKMRIIQKNIITETRKAYWEMVFTEQSMDVTAETIDALIRLKDVATTLYKSGKTSFQDVIKINIKIEILKEDLLTLSSKKRNIEARLNELLNLPANTRMGDVVLSGPDKNIPGPDTLFSRARQNSQGLKIIRHQINKVQTLIEMAESMIQAPFTLNFSSYEDAAINSVGSGAQKSSFAEKSMAAMENNTPLNPWYGIDDPWLNQTRQTLLSLKQTLVKQENATDRMVRDAWFAVDKNKRELLLYKDRILSLSKSALDVSTREYESGSIPFSQAIDSYTDWLSIKLAIAKRQTDLGSSTATLEQIIGIRF